MHFVVAGTGYTGRRVLARLTVGSAIGISRSPLADAEHEVRSIDLDRNDGESLVLPVPYTLLYTIPPGPMGDDDPRLAGFLARLAAPPTRVVYLSTSGVYGDRDGEPTDESVPPNPSTARAKRRVAAENRLRDWCNKHDAAWLILRVPGIYGPGRLGLDRLRTGATILREQDAGPSNRIHVDDLVACCLAAMTGDAPAGIYNVSDGDHQSSSEFSRRVAALAGLPPPAELSMAEATREWSEARLSFLSESRRLDTTKMREVLGVVPEYLDPDDGIRASLALSSD